MTSLARPALLWLAIWGASLGAVDTWAQSPSNGAPTPLSLGVPVTGAFGPGDFGLEQVLPVEAGDVTWTDRLVFQGVAGQTVRFQVGGSVPIYLAVVDPFGERLAGAGTQGDELAPQLTLTLAANGAHTVVVNSYHGDVGTYTAVASLPLDGPPLDLAPVATQRLGLSPPAALLGLGAPQSGTLGDGDASLEALVAGNDGDLTWADAYVVDGLSGRGLRVEVDASVPVYVALLDAAGELLEGDGTEGDQNFGRLVYVPADDGPLTVVVNSYHGHYGTYTVAVQSASNEDLAALSAALPVDGELSPGRPIRDAIDPSRRIYRTYVVDVPEGATTLAITTESAHNIDLFVRYGRQILASWNTEPDFSGISEGGNEVVRVSAVSQPALRSGRYYIDVVAFMTPEEREAGVERPFTVTAALTQTVIPVIVESVPINTEGMVTGMFAAELLPGRRIAARIEPSVSPLQVWTVRVPPGSRRLEIRTFEASGRLDVVLAPPGVNLPNAIAALLGLPHRAITARDNERVVVDASTHPPLQPGNYTVAVLDLYSEVASDYDVAVSLDEPLAPMPAFAPPSADELAALRPMERAVRGTVQITLSLAEGGLEFGSGSMVTPDGIILTNHHVVGGCEHSSPYLLGCVGDIHRLSEGTPVDVFVGLSNEHQTSAEQQFVARVIRSLPDYDLALLQIVSDLEGRPLEVALPTLPVDTRPNALALGDPIAVIGYPGVAGLGSRISLSMTRGFVTGFTDDRGQRVFINVDANIAGGNSGGTLVDERGYLVGVPSNQNLIRDRGERQDFARSLTLLPTEWVQLLRAHGAEVL